MSRQRAVFPACFYIPNPFLEPNGGKNRLVRRMLTAIWRAASGIGKRCSPFDANSSFYSCINMKKIIYNLVYNRKKCLNRRGMALVQVEAYLHRRKKYFSTRVYLKPDQWDARRAEVRNHPHASTLNRMLGEFVITLEQKELELWKQGYHCSLEVLKEVMTKGHHAASFLHVMASVHLVSVLGFICMDHVVQVSFVLLSHIRWGSRCFCDS